MLSFLKIGQFLKKVGNGEGNNKEAKESSNSSQRGTEPTVEGASTLLKDLPPNAGTHALLVHVQRIVHNKYPNEEHPGNDTNKKKSDPIKGRIGTFLRILRSEESSENLAKSSTSCLDLSCHPEQKKASSVTARVSAETSTRSDAWCSFDVDALQKDRADMIDAIDVCLQEIPDISRSMKTNGSSFLPPAFTKNRDTDHLSPVLNSSQISPVTLKGRTAENGEFDLVDWRRLLLEVVEVLIAIDATLYFEFFHRAKVVQMMDNKFLPELLPTDSVSNKLKRRKSEAGKDKGNGLKRDISVELSKTLDDLLGTACSIASWVMLRSVLLHQLHKFQNTLPNSATGSSVGMNGTVIKWPEVVAELRRIFSKEHEYLAECILCAAFLRDDGRELMYCFIQEPKSIEVLQNAIAFTYETTSFSPRHSEPHGAATNASSSPLSAARLAPSTAMPQGSTSAPPPAVKITSPSRKSTTMPSLSTTLVSSPAPVPDTAGYLTGVSVDDLNDEVEAKYQRLIANSWSQYLEDILLLSPLQVNPAHFSDAAVDSPSKVRRTNSRTFCQLATAYFFCSDEWAPEERDKRFQLLEETDVRKSAEEKIRRDEKGLPKRGIDGDSGTTKSIYTSPLCSIEEQGKTFSGETLSTLQQKNLGLIVLQEIETRILNMSWTAALHKRVEHCVAARPPMLGIANHFVEKERAAACVFNDFRAKQRALTSAINTFLAAGLSQEALSCSRRHFTNEKKEWACRKQTLFSAVRYLQSMVQLVQAQAAYQAHMAVIETVQIVFPQADLCEKMLSVLVPHPRGAFILRFSDTRAKVLRSRIYLLQEGWRSHAFMKDSKDTKYFNDYLQCLRQIRTRCRESRVYDARVERGHQLMQRKQYTEAAEHFHDAVQLAKRAELTSTRAPHNDAEESHLPSGPLTNASFHRSIHLKVAGSGSLTTAEEHINKNRSDNKELERMWRLAESERLLAFAYVSQAENEVNIPQRRIELNNAVRYAYAAQATLHKWQAKGGTPKRMLTAVPCSMIVICKALMLLNQPKKAMLLLEPLIEEKASSVLIRPPMWGEILQPTPEPLTAEDIVLRMDVNSVTIDVYQLYTQCIVQFDEEKALRAVELVRNLLIEGDRWIRAVGEEIQQSDPQSDPVHSTASPTTPPGCLEDEEDTCGTESVKNQDTDFDLNPSESVTVVLESNSERLRALRALRRGSWDICRALRDIKIATGDAFCKLKQWDEALKTYESLLYILRDKTSSSGGINNEDLKLSSHYRLSAGPSTQGLGSSSKNESEAPSGLSPAWRALLYGDDNIENLAPLDDQMRSITQEESDDGFGKMAPGEDLVVVMAEEERVDHHAAANLIYSKLAGVYEAVGDLQTSIRYLKLVLAYSTEIRDESLQYKSLLRLARLYTATNSQRESQETWEKVSALAREYEDQEVCRETMRNIINAKQAAGKYFEVVQSAEELNGLAQAAEGTGAAADRRFALENLAFAHLQLGKFDECLVALDERETVQEKSGEWNGKLYEMRAKARIGKGEFSMAIKVLSTWVSKAKQMKNFEEIGNGNSALATAYAAESDVRSEIRAQRCHIDAIAAFSQLPTLTAEHRASLLSSARWLIHYFYLSEELVDLFPAARKSEGRKDATRSTSPAVGRTVAVPLLENRSGNLAVLISEEERRRDGLPSLLKGNVDCDDTLSNLGLRRDKSATLPELVEDIVLAEGVKATAKGKERKESGSTGARSAGSTGSLGNVSMCNRPAAAALGTDVLEQPPPSLNDDGGRRQDDHSAAEGSTHRGEGSQGPGGSEEQRVLVPTRYCQAAVEIMEWCTQIIIQRGRHGTLLSQYSPAEAVDLALLTHPNCTFIFFFAEYTAASSGSYDVVIRPARSSYFITKSSQVTAIHPYKEAVENVPIDNDPTDDKGPSLAFAAELQQQLIFLYDELWGPVASGLRSAKSKLEHADCVFIVPDASLYNVPFGGLISKNRAAGKSFSKKTKVATPLGAQATLVVVPSLSHLVQRGMLRDGGQSQFLQAQQFSRYAVLADVYVGKSVKPETEEVISVAKRTLFGRKTTVAPTTTESVAAVVPESEPLKSLTSWTVQGSITRKGLNDVLRDKSTKAVILGCPVTNTAIKTSDGSLVCEDIISHTSHSLSKKEPQFNCRHLELLVLQNSQHHRTTEEQPGVSIKLCFHTGCPRVLRVEDVTGQSLGTLQRRMVVRYVENLDKVLRCGLDYPFALALRMTIKDAFAQGLPASIWAGLTLVGAP